MRVFEGEQLGAERTLVVVDGLVNLREKNTNKEEEVSPPVHSGELRSEVRAYLLQVLVDGDVSHDVLLIQQLLTPGDRNKK